MVNSDARASKAKSYRSIWSPQPGPQSLLIKCPFPEMFYGGARGGGKTSGILGHWAKHAGKWGKFAKGIIFRRTYDELEEVHEQASHMYGPIGAKYSGYKRTWIFPNGAKIKFRYLAKDKDADHYQGHSYTWIGIEEITNFPSPDPINKLRGTLRSSDGVVCQWVATGNPGGPGHNWVKARYISPMPPLQPYTDPKTGEVRIFIPAKLQDNAILMRNDPRYVHRLHDSGPEWLVKAWLDGNWDIVAGGMFDDIWDSAKNIIPPFAIPSNWIIDRSFDWGSTKPFSLGWWAESNGEKAPNGVIYKKGTLFRIGEWYGCTGKPNEGLKMLAVEIAKKGREMELQRKWNVQPGPADPSIFSKQNGMCIADDMSKAGMQFHPGDASPGSRKNGWELMRKMIKAVQKQPMEDPGLYVFENCRDFIRTVPVAPRDKNDPMDIDTASEDHVLDDSRYRCMFKRHSAGTQKLVGV